MVVSLSIEATKFNLQAPYQLYQIQFWNITSQSEQLLSLMKFSTFARSVFPLHPEFQGTLLGVWLKSEPFSSMNLE